MKILIIPDIHGRDFWKKPCEHIDEYDKVIFLGDYHDPYPYQVSVKESLKNLEELTTWINEHEDKVICLIGNHDIEYITDVYVGCRYDYANAKQVAKLLKSIPLKLVYQEGKYLFSHSGVMPKWLETVGTIEDINNLDLFDKRLMKISKYRGGDDPLHTASCIWGDIVDFDYSEKIPEIYQIFGHTQMDKEAILDDYACLDCREAFVLNNDKICRL